MIAVIVPAHNEEAHIRRCLASIHVTARDSALRGEEVRVFVALDRCSDGTAAIVRHMGATAVTGHYGNVGRARAAAADAAIAAGARWLACTDADSHVPERWLSSQIHSGGDAYCGIVDIEDGDECGAAVIAAFRRALLPFDGHPHIYGANLGVSAAWYRRVGGFSALAAHEDVALVRALTAAGARIIRHACPVVWTSARRKARAPLGFSHYLRQVHMQLDAVATEQLQVEREPRRVGALGS